MTPEANDLCVFAVKRGNIGKRLDINYNAPKYTSLVAELNASFGENLTTIGQIADVICGPFGSAIKNTDYQDSGIPLVRITNISKTGYMDYSDLVYISEELGNSLLRTQVSAGDIVISQRGSLGQCAVVDEQFNKLNISANIIAIKNINSVSAEFIHDYMLSSIGQTLLERSVSGQVQQKITTQDIADLQIPINCDESRLIAIMQDAYGCYTKKLQEKEELLGGMSQYILSMLNLSLSDYKQRLCISVRLREILNDGTFSAEYYHPERIMAIHALGAQKNLKMMKLVDIVDFCREIVNSADSQAKYLGLAGVESQTGELSGANEEATGQAFIYQTGDVLYGRLRPYLNKVLLAEESGICSTEFHVMRVKNTSAILPEYLSAIMRSDLIVAQTKHMMTGNTHPRISNDDVKNLYIPVPEISMQQAIISELGHRRDKARTLKREAERDWEAAKAQFEKKLLGY